MASPGGQKQPALSSTTPSIIIAVAWTADHLTALMVEHERARVEENVRQTATAFDHGFFELVVEPIDAPLPERETDPKKAVDRDLTPALDVLAQKGVQQRGLGSFGERSLSANLRERLPHDPGDCGTTERSTCSPGSTVRRCYR